ncbi:GtrA family protein [Microbulbifer hydrolyticus]|uniref:GtrA family protein n=1 Tax=Microbulbifer hydrolyticus TaxID=48074 RepID=A0ABX6IYF8_9GAMM|nr:GtrA family protein [Microbulbifer hydrolyticus]QHQ38562.1 GtrA family protein [Microbulbifer hydrolyticus]
MPERVNKLFSRAARFAAVGGIATAIQYVFLVLLVEVAGTFEIFASALSFTLSALVNYLLNYYLTFGGSVAHRQSLPRFTVVAVVGLAINTLCFSLALTLLPYLLAQVIATLVTLVSNFLLHQFWIYREPEWNP